MTKSKAVVLDIDGVILNSTVIFEEISNLKLKGDKMWNYFHEHCNSSRVTLIQSTSSFIKELDPSVEVILSTARNEKCRESTEEKLKRENFTYKALYMRDSKDFRPSPEVKKEHIQEIRQKFDIIAFIDDDLSNCLMAEEEGILALRKV